MIIQLLDKVSKALDEKKIPYMLSGSVAMNVYTVPRMTRDIDMVINLSVSDIDKFTSIFKEGYYIYKDGIEEEVNRRGRFNVIDFDSGQKIDFIILKNTDFHLNEFNRRKQVMFYGFPVWVVSLEDLIIAKLIWIQTLQSENQMRDISNLLSVDQIDKKYVYNWITKMNLKTFNLIK